MPRTSPAASPLAWAKDRARRAYRSACETDAPLSALIDRWWSETLTQVAGQPAATSAVVLTWPDRMR
jgi:hypothetical protein